MGPYIATFVNSLRITRGDISNAQKKCGEVDASVAKAQSKMEATKVEAKYLKEC